VVPGEQEALKPTLEPERLRGAGGGHVVVLSEDIMRERSDGRLSSEWQDVLVHEPKVVFAIRVELAWHPGGQRLVLLQHKSVSVRSSVGAAASDLRTTWRCCRARAQTP
jgi:hypothetical protein